MTNAAPTGPIPPAARLRHDLLTPVNHLMGYSEMLQEQLEDLDAAALAPGIRAIENAARECFSLIQQLLPPGQEADGAFVLDSLRILLPAPIGVIANLVREIRSGPVPAAIDADLTRIATAAERLGLLLAEPGTSAEPPALAPEPADANPPEAPDSPASKDGKLLVVDDNAVNRDLLSRRLQREGYAVLQAADGHNALRMLAEDTFELVLLDVMMPEIDGFEVLRQLQASGRLATLPVIMISAMDEVQSAVRCIEMGAEDYLTKPFDPILLRARIGACLEKKRLRDEERRTAQQLRAALDEVEEQRRHAESLLLNILPARISEELRAQGSVTPKYFDDVSIVFTDFAGFSAAIEDMAADEMVLMLHDYFTAFDRIVRRYGLEKLKTIGDSYMFMGGLPPRNPSHPVDAVLACFEMLHAAEQLGSRYPQGWRIRIGMHTGPVIAGVVGVDKFAFDVWGETVNYSSRMESSGEPGRINLSERAWSRVKDFFECEHRGKIRTKDLRDVDMYFIKGVHPKLMQDAAFARRYKTYFEHEPLSFPDFLAGRP